MLFRKFYFSENPTICCLFFSYKLRQIEIFFLPCLTIFLSLDILVPLMTKAFNIWYFHFIIHFIVLMVVWLKMHKRVKHKFVGNCLARCFDG